jgi:hypothetical protein
MTWFDSTIPLASFQNKYTPVLAFIDSETTYTIRARDYSHFGFIIRNIPIMCGIVGMCGVGGPAASRGGDAKPKSRQGPCAAASPAGTHRQHKYAHQLR